MFIRLDSHLKGIQARQKDGLSSEESYAEGTLAVIDGKLDFPNTDGYIQFMKLALDNIPEAYGEQDPKWQECLDRIWLTAEKLKDANTRFTGTTSEEFKIYCEKVSSILDSTSEPSLQVLSLDIVTSENLVPCLEKHIAKGNNKGFYYEKGEDAKKGIMDDLMKQLNGMKFEKLSRNHDVSYYLRSSGYHEHVHDALNMILNTAVYAINCSSTKDKDAYGFDTQTVYDDLRYAEFIIQRIANLV